MDNIRAQLPPNARDFAYDLESNNWDDVTAKMMVYGDRSHGVLEGAAFRFSQASAGVMLDHLCPKAKTMIAFGASFLFPRLGKNPKGMTEEVNRHGSDHASS